MNVMLCRFIHKFIHGHQPKHRPGHQPGLQEQQDTDPAEVFGAQAYSCTASHARHTRDEHGT